MISLVMDPSLAYPDADDSFSPDEHFPEYAHDHISRSGNSIYRAVRQCFAQANLDRENYNTPSWNPLRALIPPGSRVFVLCNFANQRRHDELVPNFQSRCTHGSVLRALLDYVLLAVGENGSVSFGNAPTQFGHWESVLKDTGAQSVLDFYRSNGVPVKAVDLRLYVSVRNRLGAITSVERRNESDGIRVRLDSDSLFTELDSKPSVRYRIMNYSPAHVESFHSPGSHSYVVNRHILESDVILSVPKFKTHEKVGISSALKGFVGTVGHKDSLPHHRYGPPEVGGDEFPQDPTGLLRVLSALHEGVQTTKPDSESGKLARMTYTAVRRLMRPLSEGQDGGWWGNDTAWRMVLDLVRIATYANLAGEMQSVPLRRQLAFIDGILGGEGEGPAYTTAVNSGVLMFSDNLVALDWVNAILMGFDPEQIPLLREACRIPKYPLTSCDLDDENIIHNGRLTSASKFIQLEKHHFEPPPGWKGKL